MTTDDYDALVRRAATIDCPDCSAEIGHPCRNDQGQETPWIHMGRLVVSPETDC
jgi:hypothetical protein